MKNIDFEQFLQYSSHKNSKTSQIIYKMDVFSVVSFKTTWQKTFHFMGTTTSKVALFHNLGNYFISYSQFNQGTQHLLQYDQSYFIYTKFQKHSGFPI